MKFFTFVFVLFSITTGMISCKSGKQAIAGYGGGFEVSTNPSIADTAKFNKSQQSHLGHPAVSDIAFHENENMSQFDGRQPIKSIILPLTNKLKKKKGQHLISNILKKSTPAQTNGNDSGGAVFVLLLFVALIIWGLVKLAGISFWQIMLILGISIVVALLLVLLFAVILHFG